MLRVVPTPSHRLRRAVRRALDDAHGLDVASDFDGTLAPIVSHPARAVLDPRGRAALRRLARLPDVRVALLSGRRLDDLERRVRLADVFLAGLAGIETRDPSGRRHVDRQRRIPRSLVAAVEAWCARFPGAWVEDKEWAVSIHDRAVTPKRRAAFAAGLKRRLAPHRREVEVTHGRRVTELRPAGAPDKAAVLDRWLGPEHDGRLLVVLGDDMIDRPALARARALGGFAIAVGPRHLAMRHRLPGPHATVDFLEWLARMWRARRS